MVVGWPAYLIVIFDLILQKNMAARGCGLFFPKYINNKITNDISRRKTGRISTKFHRNDPWVVLSQIS